MNLYHHYTLLAESDRIAQSLQTLQHTFPHLPLHAALARSSQHTGFCPSAADSAIDVLKLDRQRKVGRLRRCELLQLARTVHRLWQQSKSAASSS
jgi:hypothetical protein